MYVVFVVFVHSLNHVRLFVTLWTIAHEAPLSFIISRTIYHIFFIHFSVNVHLSWFHVLAIVNSAPMNSGGACNFLKYGFLQINARSGIAESW